MSILLYLGLKRKTFLHDSDLWWKVDILWQSEETKILDLSGSHLSALRQIFMQKNFSMYLVGSEGRYLLRVAHTRANCRWVLFGTTNSSERRTWGEKVFYWQWKKEIDLLQDNARPHTAKTTSKSSSTWAGKFFYVYYSPDFALSDLFASFLSMQHHIADSHLSSVKEVEKSLET